MKLAGAKTAKQFTRWLQARFSGGALILGYHRISVQGDFYEVCVSPENFAEHLHELRKRTHPIRLSKLVQHLRDGSLPDKAVAITFDDGYTDNLYAAKPLLEKYEIPATVFICTGYMGREFWWDELERLVTCSQTDLGALRLHAGGKQFEWHGANMSLKAEEPAVRHKFCRALYHFLLSLDVGEQNNAMGLIRSWCKVSPPEISTQRAIRAMTEHELLQLVDGGLIELGAHTRHHPMLPQLSFERQREEIESSKKDLETLLGKRIAGFSYPNGRATMDAKRLIQEMGFAYACTSLHDVVRPRSDVYELTRFWQQDLNGDQFVKRLNRWMRMSA
jgi:peptidoglycan/xylan/chitin deacetylase (PgdA/CDA1 family)